MVSLVWRLRTLRLPIKEIVNLDPQKIFPHRTPDIPGPDGFETEKTLYTFPCCLPLLPLTQRFVNR